MTDQPIGDPPLSPEERREPPSPEPPLGEPPPPRQPDDPPLSDQPPIGDPMPKPSTPKGDPPDSSNVIKV